MTNNTDGAALLPVTPDRRLKLTMPDGEVLHCEYPDSPVWAKSWSVWYPATGRIGTTGEQDWEIVDRYSLTSLFEAFEREILARHRQSSSNAGGVDPKRIEDCINAAIGHGEHGIFVDVAKATESILASLSTPTTEPDPDDRAQNKAGGLWYRRWHDAQTRVNELESMLVNPPEPTGDSLRPGLERAAQWHDARCKGPDVFEQELHENSAKALRHLAANPDATDMQALEAALTTPPTPHEFVKNPLIPFPSCQVCMGPENAEAHSPPTPDRIGKDAVREALGELWSIVHGCDLRLSVPMETIHKVRAALQHKGEVSRG